MKIFEVVIGESEAGSGISIGFTGVFFLFLLGGRRNYLSWSLICGW